MSWTIGWVLALGGCAALVVLGIGTGHLVSGVLSAGIVALTVIVRAQA